MKFEEKLRQLFNDHPAPRRLLPVSIGSLCACAARLALLLLCTVAAVAPALAQTPTLGPIVKIFVGKIRTMDGSNRVVQAVGVDKRGLIVAVGSRKDVLHVAGGDLRVIRLKPGQTLLPGFFDAHLHLDALLTTYSGLAYLVGPCFPGPYASANTAGCKPYIKETFGVVRKKLEAEAKKLDADAREKLNATFLVGINLDPSRQPYAKATLIAKEIPSAAFKEEPAYYIEKNLTKDRPVLIIDQSGHFGYVNHAAFSALREVFKVEGKSWPPGPFPEGGEWNRTPKCIEKSPVDTGEIDCYTGLLTEQPGYSPFFQAVKNKVFNDRGDRWNTYVSLLGGGLQGVRKTLKAFRTAGLTTVTTMADSADEVSAWGLLAKLPGSGIRIASIVKPDTAYEMVDKKLTEDSQGVPMPIKPACYPTADGCRLPRDLGVSAIKILLDGSTQGCTAALQAPVSYQEKSECRPPDGRSNYTPEQLVKLRNETLKKLWESGEWRFEFHANGNRAFADALDLFSSLLDQKRNDHTATILHATVISGNGEEAPWARAQGLRKPILVEGKTVPNLDLRFSHLIGHVPYWGDVLERQLGKDSAQNIDPTGSDLHYGIPFTLHSDATVSVPRPLWFVRQAVTRETWTYPGLKPSSMHVLGPDQRITVLEALRAITIRAAEEKELDRWLGSIEVGKVADFVVLSEDPMLYEPGPPTNGDPTKISDIKVVDTYLGGVKTGLVKR